jgi:hypothetical protein
MYKIHTTDVAIREAFKKFHENALEFPEDFNEDYANYNSDQYSELVTNYFLELLEDAST